MLASWSHMGPVPRAALTSCALMALGDACCQTIQARRQAGVAASAAAAPPQHAVASSSAALDLQRTARFAVIGLTLHGPFFCKGFQWLDARFGKQATFRNAITKSLAGQVTLFPAYTSLFLLYASLLEGRSLRGSWERLRERLPNLLVTGSVYWPVVNVLNFKLLPPSQRVLAVNVCAIAWNTYLSYVTTHASPSVAAAAGVAS